MCGGLFILRYFQIQICPTSYSDIGAYDCNPVHDNIWEFALGIKMIGLGIKLGIKMCGLGNDCVSIMGACVYKYLLNT